MARYTKEQLESFLKEQTARANDVTICLMSFKARVNTLVDLAEAGHMSKDELIEGLNEAALKVEDETAHPEIYQGPNTVVDDEDGRFQPGNL